MKMGSISTLLEPSELDIAVGTYDAYLQNNIEKTSLIFDRLLPNIIQAFRDGVCSQRRKAAFYALLKIAVCAASAYLIDSKRMNAI